MFPYGETVVRLRAPLVADPYSGAATKRDWSAAASLPIADCVVDPGGSLYGPYDADVIEGDRIVSASGTWDVQGHGAHWVSPFTGWQPGAVWPLRRSDGWRRSDG